MSNQLDLELSTFKRIYNYDISGKQFPDEPGIWLVKQEDAFEVSIFPTKILINGDNTPVIRIGEGDCKPVSRLHDIEWIMKLEDCYLPVAPSNWIWQDDLRHLSMRRYFKKRWIHSEFRTLGIIFADMRSNANNAILVRDYPPEKYNTIGLYIHFNADSPSYGYSYTNESMDGKGSLDPYPLKSQQCEYVEIHSIKEAEDYVEENLALVGDQVFLNNGYIPYDGGIIREFCPSLKGKPRVFKSLDEFEKQHSKRGTIQSFSINDELVNETYYNFCGVMETEELYNSGRKWESDFIKAWSHLFRRS